MAVRLRIRRLSPKARRALELLTVIEADPDAVTRALAAAARRRARKAA